MFLENRTFAKKPDPDVREAAGTSLTCGIMISHHFEYIFELDFLKYEKPDPGQIFAS